MTCPTPRLSVERIVEIIACARICDLKSGESLGDVERRSSTIHSVFERLRLGKIDGAIAGDLAVLAYIEGRNARYLDLLLDWDDSLALNPDEVSVVRPGFATARFDNLEVNIMLADNPLFSLVKRSHCIAGDGLPISIATPKGIVMTSLYSLPYWYGMKDCSRGALLELDISLLARACHIDLYQMYRAIAPYLSVKDALGLQEVVADLERKKVLLEARRQRFLRQGRD